MFKRYGNYISQQVIQEHYQVLRTVHLLYALHFIQWAAQLFYNALRYNITRQ